jgi:hypothetical protein
MLKVRVLFLVPFLVLGFVLISCSVKTPRGPSSASGKPRHFVITLHGVRGNAETFGDFHQIVKENLPMIDSKFEVIPVPWVYPVGKAVDDQAHQIQWEPHSIADKFNQEMFLAADAKLKDLGPNDQISIVAYSMGGLMAMTWYYDTMFDFVNFPSLQAKYSQYSSEQRRGLHQALSQVKNIVGLGAVFWGSLEAEFGWSIFEEGKLKEASRAIPKVRAACESKALQDIIGRRSLLGDMWASVTGASDNLSLEEKQDKFISDLVTVMCSSVTLLPATVTSIISKDLDAIVPDSLVESFGTAIKFAGNIDISELDNMRLTSQAINAMRIARIKHMVDPSLREKYPARWTSVVGVFPCLGGVDGDQSCQNFKNPKYKVLNDALVTIFSGTLRRETDGAVASPNTVADFIFYTELDPKGAPLRNITKNQFQNTFKLNQVGKLDLNQEIFVENMHATLSPALEAMGSIGKNVSADMLNFDQSLGKDVAIMNKECAIPENCKHPNYKHVLQALSRCEVGSTNGCNEGLLNRYFGVNVAEERMKPSDELRSQMGSYILNFNIRLPAGFNPGNLPAHKLLKSLTILGSVNKNSAAKQTATNDPFMEGRVDTDKDPYIHQIGRSREIISSFAYLVKERQAQILRVFYIGRVLPKPGQEAQARSLMAEGIPVSVDIKLPGMLPRQVQAVVKPTYTTYVDMFLAAATK